MKSPITSSSRLYGQWLSPEALEMLPLLKREFDLNRDPLIRLQLADLEKTEAERRREAAESGSQGRSEAGKASTSLQSKPVPWLKPPPEIRDPVERAIHRERLAQVWLGANTSSFHEPNNSQTAKEATMTQEKKAGPIQTIGHSDVKIKIWEQNGPHGSFPNATIAKTYRDKETGQIRDGNSFSQTDLLKLEKLLPQADAEMNRWREYFSEIGKSSRSPEASEKTSNSPSLVEQRDAVMGKVPAQDPTPSRQRTQER